MVLSGGGSTPAFLRDRSLWEVGMGAHMLLFAKCWAEEMRKHPQPATPLLEGVFWVKGGLLTCICPRQVSVLSCRSSSQGHPGPWTQHSGPPHTPECADPSRAWAVCQASFINGETEPEGLPWSVFIPEWSGCFQERVL